MRLTSDGRRLPLEAGTLLKNYRIEAVQSLYDRSFYLARDGQSEVVLAESPAFFTGPIQTQVWAAAADVMQAQGLELLDWFQAAWQGVEFNYAVYPRWLWEALDETLKPETADEQLIQQVYHWLRQQQQALAKIGWVNPSLALPWLLQRPNGQLIQLEWEYCVPLDGRLNYPRFLVGYHHACANQMPEPARMGWTAAYATLLALLQGKPPQLWAPQLVSWRSVQPLLSREMRQWLNNWPQQALALYWPDLPALLYRRGADLKTYTAANLAWQRAQSALAAGAPTAALEAAGLSGKLYLNDPWPAYLTAKALIALKQPEAAAEALEAAWRLEPLAAVAKTGAQLTLEFPDSALSASAASDRLASILTSVPQDDEAWVLQARLAIQSGHLATAEACLRRACRLRPLNPDYQRLLAELQTDPAGLEHIKHLESVPLAGNRRLQAQLHSTQSVKPEAQSSQPLQPSRWQFDSPLREQGLHPATLWRGRERSTGKPVLLKLFPLANTSARESWQREASSASHLSALKHPVLLPLKAAEALSDNTGLIAYPWYEVPNCEQLLRQGPMSSADVLAIASQLESALEALNSIGLSHGDITPANLLWHQGKVKLIDHDNLGPQDRQLELFWANPAYADPQRRRTGLTGDDRYSLAISLIHLASGLFPDLFRSWQNRDYSGIKRYLLHLPTDWIEAVIAASRWDPERRRKLSLSAQGCRPVPTWLSDLSQAVIKLAQAEELKSGKLARENLLSCERSALSLYHSAFHSLRLGERELALHDARNCLKADANHLGAHWILAELQIASEAFETAASTLQHALALDPDAPETYQLLIRLYSDAGAFIPAWSACDQLARCLPLSADADASRFSLLWRFGCYSQARALGRKLLRSRLEPERKTFIRERLNKLAQDHMLAGGRLWGVRPGSHMA